MVGRKILNQKKFNETPEDIMITDYGSNKHNEQRSKISYRMTTLNLTNS
jgi:hypothetical protein